MASAIRVSARVAAVTTGGYGEVLALVGRDGPASVLDGEINRTIESHGGLVLVAGEAGIGKTALVAEAVERARRRGALVASGACWELEEAPGYWPWVQVVRSLRLGIGPEEWAAARSAAGGELDMLLGEARARGGAGPAGLGAYDAVTTLLVTASRNRPVVIVLDDLHWADGASIRLLDFVARHAWFEQLLVVGAYRDVEIEAPGHPLGRLIRPLVAQARTVMLAGLGRDEVRVLLARTAGRQPSDEMVAEVHRRTGGNPFFVNQTAHLWQSGSAVDAITPGVRDAVERRLALLPDEVVEVLTVAAVLGPEFRALALAAVIGADVRAVSTRLDTAVSARLAVPVGDDRFAFVHDLMRETLYRGLDESEARRWHAAVVKAFETTSELAGHAVPAELAHHAYHAVPEVAVADAVALLGAAGRDAADRLAFDEAVGHHRRALDLVPEDRPQERAAVALELGPAQHDAGQLAAMAETFEEVAVMARRLDDRALLARAALGLGWLGGRVSGAARVSVAAHAHPARVSDLSAALVREAHGKLVGQRAGGAPERKTDLEVEQELSARVVELARELGDDDLLWAGLTIRHDAIWAPGTAPERERLAEEMLMVARRAEDRRLWLDPWGVAGAASSELYAAVMRASALLELGDPRCYDTAAASVGLAERTDLVFPRFLSLWTQAALTSFTGRFAEAHVLLDEAFELGPRRFGWQRSDVWTALVHQQRWALALLQGRLDQADGLARSAGDEGHPYPQLLEAITAVQGGDADRVLGYLSQDTAGGANASRWFAALWLRFRAQAAAASRDPQLCEGARAELAPLSGQWLVTCGGIVDGPALHWLAELDAAQERWDEAIERFTAAREAADRIRARPWSIMARLGLAETLRARHSPTDGHRVAQLLEEVEREAVEIGMLQVAERARRARDGRARPAGLGEGALPPRAERDDANMFRLDGDVWTLRFAGRTVHMPDAKGLRDLHVLLGRPGVDVPAVHLLDPSGGEVVRASRQLGGDAVLDEQAKAAYRDRLTDLDEEIDRALDRGDDDRAAELDRERDALIGELRRAVGLGGRPRRLGDEAERARKAVSERVRDVFRRLDRRHPELAGHLRSSVSTGARCRYQPPEGLCWAL
jgi:tetratricopeptide (TPR) repeat protein